MRFARLTAPFALLALVATAPALAADKPALAADKPSAAPTFAGFPWLGIAMDSGGDIGVRVETVTRGSPAERSGVRVGDRIVSIDGKRVTAPAQVSSTVAAHKVGESVAIGLERAGNALSLAVVLAVRPSGDDLLRMHLVGAPAPAWANVAPLTGAPTSVAALKGKVVLIDFWASWCGPCRFIAPRLSTLKDRLGPQGLAVVGITTDAAEQAAVFAERHQMRYPVVVDTDGDTSRAYNITGLPTMVLVDRTGVVRDVFIGIDPTSETRLDAAIRKLLAEPGGPPTIPAPSVPRPQGR